MRHLTLALITLCALVITGCASIRSYGPVVEKKSSPARQYVAYEDGKYVTRVQPEVYIVTQEVTYDDGTTKIVQRHVSQAEWMEAKVATSASTGVVK